ncbi:hypothetical protein [Sphingobacterium sp.]|uniref:hypothetical protein n=1 Tax=Sphingobacterium sp. TaxID=341027 RepID=UPI0031DF8A4B
MFSQKRTIFRRSVPEIEGISETILAALSAFNKIDRLAPPIIFSKKGTEVNISYVGFRIRIHNTGQIPIQDYKLQLQFDGNIQYLNSSNIEDESFPILTHKVRFSTFLDADNLTVTISPLPAHSLIVSEDFFTSEEIFLKPHPDEKAIKAKWKLISRDYKAEGELNINLESKIEWTTTIITVDDIDEERTEYGEIEDFIKILE